MNISSKVFVFFLFKKDNVIGVLKYVYWFAQEMFLSNPASGLN